MKTPESATRLPGVIRMCNQNERSYGTSISKVARHFGMVDQHARILEVADELQQRTDLPVLGVVDDQGRPVGFVTRDQLFATLGKPYGRDILSRSPIRDLCFAARSFYRHANLFIIVEELSAGATISDALGHFVLVDDQGRFAAIFSNHDLMGFLSRMTQEDIEMASRLQERMIGTSAREAGEGWSFHAWCHPAKGVGGDFYFSRQLADGRWFMTLCDVSGKGVAASILSSMVWGMLSMYDFRLGLKTLVSRLNEAVISTFQLERYLTGVFMVWDPSTKRLIWADMGHSHITIGRQGRIKFLSGSQSNLPVGLEPGIDPAICAATLGPGDRIFVFTDGITEQENPSKEEFGEARLFDLLKGQGPETREASILAERIPLSLETWRQTIPQQDDMSFVLLELENAD